MNEEITDADLVSRFKTESTREKAFSEIVKKYQERLYWHIRRMVVLHEDADDVLQNTFIKVWKSLENFREESQLYTWMYRIATNETLTFLDKKKRNLSISIDDTNNTAAHSLKSDSNFDEKKAEWKLHLAIAQLPEKQRMVFNLRYFDEMPYNEMSNILQTSEGALKASFHHAVKKIEDFILNS